MRYDAEVVVIGAGPAGSRAAERLAAAGHDVLLLERRKSLGEPVCCTGIISRECFSRFDIDPAWVLRSYSGARLHAPGGNVIDVRRSSVQAVAVDRAAFDRSLAEKAVASGSRLLLGTTAINIETNSGAAIIDVVQQGEHRRLIARAAVIAAGLSPRLTRALGLGQVSDAALGFQLEVETIEPVEVEVFLGRGIAPGFFAWLAPVADNRAKIGLIARRRADANLQRLVESLRSQGKIGRTIGEIRCRAIPLSTLPRTFTDQILVVGDAAGQVKSTTGGGLYYGLVCADLAAETLHRSLITDNLSTAALSVYQRRWRQVLGRDQMLGRLARNIFQRLSDCQIDRLLLRAGNTGLIERLLGDESLTFDRHGRAIVRAAGSLLPAALGW